MGANQSAETLVRTATDELGAHLAFAWLNSNEATSTYLYAQIRENILRRGFVERLWLSVADAVEVNEVKRILLPRLLANEPLQEISDDPELFIKVIHKQVSPKERFRIFRPGAYPRLFEPIPGAAGRDLSYDRSAQISFSEHLAINVYGQASSSTRHTLFREFISSSQQPGVISREWMTKLMSVLYPSLELVDTNKPASTSTDIKARHHPNLLPVYMMVETASSFCIIAPHMQFSLEDLIRFRQGGLADSNTRRLFVLYQIVHVLAHIHSNGIVHGRLSANNILVDDLSWIRLTGLRCTLPNQRSHQLTHAKPQSIPPAVSMDSPTERWQNGDLSNFEYLLIINQAAGRRAGNPAFHPAIPWVIDFSEQSFENEKYRDLTKTKFRLNKGDEQLDITFDSSIPHHITDILTDITYYVYLARRLPVSILRRHVRAKYEPNEYPMTMRRMYQWTPDECIPEFFTDPTIFYSTHSDMPDLHVPVWASSPAEFVRLHREALESDYVSMHLHHWIDLTFGYKLHGRFAVEAKNVPLNISDGGVAGRPLRHGIVQLFRDPHPQRLLRSHQFEMPITVNLDSSKDTIQPQVIDKVASFLFNHPLPSIKPKPLSFVSPPSIVTDDAMMSATASAYSDRTMNMSKRKISATAISPSILTSSSTVMPQQHVVSVAQVDPVRRLAALSNRRYVFSAFAQTDPVMQEAAGVPATLLGALAGSTPAQTERQLLIERATAERANLSASSVLTPLTPVISDNVVSSLPSGFAIPLLPIPLSTRGVDPDAFIGPIARLEQVKAFSQRHERLQPRDHHNEAEVVNKVQQEASFEEACAQDMADLAQIILQLFSEPFEEAGTGTTSAFAPLHSPKRQTLFPSLMPSRVAALVSQLTDPDWRKRPTAFGILSGSEVNGLSPFSSQIASAYAFLATFTSALSWNDRLELAKRDLASICALSNEVFEFVLPWLLLLFKCSETKVSALTLVDRLGSRLGPHKTRAFLMKPFLALFETQSADVYRQVLRPNMLEQLLGRLGMREILKQLVPFLLDGLFIGSDDNVVVSSANAPTSPSLSFNPNNTPSNETTVSSLASSLILAVSNLVGPILAAKYISVPLLRRLLTEAGSSPVLLHTLTALGSQFGETFITMHYLPALVNSLETHSSKPNGRTGTIISNVLSLMEKLILQIPAVSVVTALDSQLGALLRVLLSPLPKQPKLDAPSRARICRKTIELLLYISHSISRSHWEKRILPILQTFFTPFNDVYDQPTPTTSAMTSSISSSYEQSEPERPLVLVAANDEQRPIYTADMAAYAYSQFCQLIGQETMRRYVANSDLIERLMYSHLMTREEPTDLLITATSSSSTEATAPATATITSTAATLSTTEREPKTIADEEPDEELTVEEETPLQFQQLTAEGLVGEADRDIAEEDDTHSDHAEEDVDASVDTSVTFEDATNNNDQEYIEQKEDEAEHDTTNTTDLDLTIPSTPIGLFSPITAASMSIVPSVVSALSLSTKPSTQTTSSSVASAVGSSSQSQHSPPNKTNQPTLPAGTTKAQTSTKPTRISFGNTSGFGAPTGFWRGSRPHANKDDSNHWKEYFVQQTDPSNSASMASAWSFNDLRLKAYSGHTGAIRSLSVSSSERLALTASKDKTVKVWSLGVQRGALAAGEGSALAFGECLKTYNGHRRAVIDATFVHGGRHVFSCDGQFHLWEMESGRLLYQADLTKSNIACVGHLPRYGMIVAATTTGTLQFIDYRSRCMQQTWKVLQGIAGTVRALAIEPISNDLIAIGFSTGMIYLIDARTGRLLNPWKAHDSDISQLQFLENDWLVSTATDGSVVQWDVAKEKNVRSAFKGLGDIAAMHLGRDLMISVGTTNILNWFSIEKQTLQPPEVFNLRQSNLRSPVTTICALPLHQLVLFGCDDGQLVLYA